MKFAAAIACCLLLPIAVGCAPRRPVSLDYVPNLTAAAVNCKQAEFFANAYVEKFRSGWVLSKFSDCYTIAITAAKFESAGGPCPEPEELRSVDNVALGAVDDRGEFLTLALDTKNLLHGFNVVSVGSLNRVARTGTL
jgi:hypothetical protein